MTANLTTAATIAAAIHNSCRRVRHDAGTFHDVLWSMTSDTGVISSPRTTSDYAHLGAIVESIVAALVWRGHSAYDADLTATYVVPRVLRTSRRRSLPQRIAWRSLIAMCERDVRVRVSDRPSWSQYDD